MLVPALIFVSYTCSGGTHVRSQPTMSSRRSLTSSVTEQFRAFNKSLSRIRHVLLSQISVLHSPAGQVDLRLARASGSSKVDYVGAPVWNTLPSPYRRLHVKTLKMRGPTFVISPAPRLSKMTSSPSGSLFRTSSASRSTTSSCTKETA